MTKPLRVMLASTALIILPQIGQFISWKDVATMGHESDLAIFFKFAAIFIIPTTVIISAAILYSVRNDWRNNLILLSLGTFNIIIGLNLIWFLARG